MNISIKGEKRTLMRVETTLDYFFSLTPLRTNFQANQNKVILTDYHIKMLLNAIEILLT